MPAEEAESKGKFRIVIEAEANASLENAVRKVNKAYEGGSVTKSDVATYLFLNADKFLSTNEVSKIRAINFDEKKSLERLLQTAPELPEDIRNAVRSFYGLPSAKPDPLRAVARTNQKASKKRGTPGAQDL